MAKRAQLGSAERVGALPEMAQICAAGPHPVK
jgi:hypothetical protein